MGFEYEKYLRAIKPASVPRSMAPYLPEVILSATEEEYQEFMNRKLYPDLDGYIWQTQMEAEVANKNIRQEYGAENKSLDYNI